MRFCWMGLDWNGEVVVLMVWTGGGDVQECVQLVYNPCLIIKIKKYSFQLLKIYGG